MCSNCVQNAFENITRNGENDDFRSSELNTLPISGQGLPVIDLSTINQMPSGSTSSDVFNELDEFNELNEEYELNGFDIHDGEDDSYCMTSVLKQCKLSFVTFGDCLGNYIFRNRVKMHYDDIYDETDALEYQCGDGYDISYDDAKTIVVKSLKDTYEMISQHEHYYDYDDKCFKSIVDILTNYMNHVNFYHVSNTEPIRIVIDYAYDCLKRVDMNYVYEIIISMIIPMLFVVLKEYFSSMPANVVTRFKLLVLYAKKINVKLIDFLNLLTICENVEKLNFSSNFDKNRSNMVEMVNLYNHLYDDYESFLIPIINKYDELNKFDFISREIIYINDYLNDVLSMMNDIQSLYKGHTLNIKGNIVDMFWIYYGKSEPLRFTVNMMNDVHNMDDDGFNDLISRHWDRLDPVEQTELMNITDRSLKELYLFNKFYTGRTSLKEYLLKNKQYIISAMNMLKMMKINPNLLKRANFYNSIIVIRNNPNNVRSVFESVDTYYEDCSETLKKLEYSLKSLN